MGIPTTNSVITFLVNGEMKVIIIVVGNHY